MAHMFTKTKIAQAAVIAGGVVLSVALFIGSFYVRALRALVLVPLASCPVFLLWYQVKEDGAKDKFELARVSGALRESEHRFKATFDHAAGMGLTNNKGEWVRVNKSLCNL